jgi:hypothetical protein
MKNIFTDHPQSMNETYWQHFACAVKFGSKMFIGGIACLIHAIFPFIFQKTGSNLLFQMMHDYVDRSPNVEDRVVVLSQTLEQKKAQ